MCNIVVLHQHPALQHACATCLSGFPFSNASACTSIPPSCNYSDHDNLSQVHVQVAGVNTLWSAVWRLWGGLHSRDRLWKEGMPNLR